MTWSDPDRRRRRMADRFRRCTEKVDTSRHLLAWVKLSVEGNFLPAITSQVLPPGSLNESVGVRLEALSRETAELIAGLGHLAESLRDLERDLEGDQPGPSVEDRAHDVLSARAAGEE